MDSGWFAAVSLVFTVRQGLIGFAMGMSVLVRGRQRRHGLLSHCSS